MIMAAAQGYDDGRLEAVLRLPAPTVVGPRPARAGGAGGPGIFLFSNYIWSTPTNLAHSALVKQLNPHHVTDPRRARHAQVRGRRRAVLRRQPPRRHRRARRGRGHLRRICSRRCAATSATARPTCRCSPTCPGLSFRDGDRRRPDRPRATASPTSTRSRRPCCTGLYDGFIPAGGGPGGLNLETNRGCPYGCTFCDWGSATLSRIRKFDLDRVFAELEWCAKNGFKVVHRRRQLRDLRARRRDRREDRRAQGHLRLPAVRRHQLRQEHREAPVADHRDLHRGRHRRRGQDVAADVRRGHARHHPAQEHQGREVRRPRRSSSGATSCRCRSTS